MENLNSENAILGICLKKPEMIATALDEIRGEYFTSEVNFKAWNRLVEMLDEGKMINESTLSAEKVIPTEKIVDYIEAFIVDQELGTHIKNVRLSHQRRKALDIFTKYGRAIKRGEFNEAEADGAINEIESLFIGSQKEFNMKETVRELFDRWERGLQNQWSGLSWGIPKLNNATKGMEPKMFYVIGALKKSGKTKFGLSIIYKLLLDQIPVLFFSLEMAAESIVEWLYALHCSINTKNFGSSRLSTSMPTLSLMTPEILKMPIFIEDRRLDISQIKIKAKYYVRKHKIKAIFLDHLQLIPFKGDERLAIDEHCRVLKDLAKELDVPVIAISQLQNIAENVKRPNLGHLKGSGGIGENVDCAIILTNKTRQEHLVSNANPETQLIHLIVDAQRHGESGILIELVAKLQYNSFREMEPVERNNFT